MLLSLLPVNVSAWLVPITFSTLISVSLPAPVEFTPLADRLTVTPPPLTAL